MLTEPAFDKEKLKIRKNRIQYLWQIYVNNRATYSNAIGKQLCAKQNNQKITTSSIPVKLKEFHYCYKW